MLACILTTRSSRVTSDYRGELEGGVEEGLEVEVQAGPGVGVEDGMVEEEEEGSFLEDGLEEAVAGTSSSTIKVPRQRCLDSLQLFCSLGTSEQNYESPENMRILVMLQIAEAEPGCLNFCQLV